VDNYFNKRFGVARPTTKDRSVCATPVDAKLIQLLGGSRQDGVVFTTDQVRALETLYGFNFKEAAEGATAYAEERHQKAVEDHEAFMADPDVSAWAKRDRKAPKPPSQSISEFIVAGSERNMFRAVKEDGMRAIALFSKFLEPGQDPVKLLVQLMDQAGWDVGDHVEWAYDEEA
jgi:hypothetical protein